MRADADGCDVPADSTCGSAGLAGEEEAPPPQAAHAMTSATAPIRTDQD
jgi:hypothetical protein